MRALLSLTLLASSVGYAGSGHIGKFPVAIEEVGAKGALKALYVKNTVLASEELVLLDKARRLLLEKEGEQARLWPIMIDIAGRSAQVWSPKDQNYFRLSLAD
jgi:hypothetical protein